MTFLFFSTEIILFQFPAPNKNFLLHLSPIFVSFSFLRTFFSLIGKEKNFRQTFPFSRKSERNVTFYALSLIAIFIFDNSSMIWWAFDLKPKFRKLKFNFFNKNSADSEKNCSFSNFLLRMIMWGKRFSVLLFRNFRCFSLPLEIWLDFQWLPHHEHHSSLTVVVWVLKINELYEGMRCRCFHYGIHIFSDVRVARCESCYDSFILLLPPW